MNGKKLNKIVSEAILNAVNSNIGIKTIFKIEDINFSIEKIISINDRYQEGNYIGSSMILYLRYDAKDITVIKPKNFAKIILFGLSENNFYEANGRMYNISNTEFKNIETIEITLEEIHEHASEQDNRSIHIVVAEPVKYDYID